MIVPGILELNGHCSHRNYGVSGAFLYVKYSLLTEIWKYIIEEKQGMGSNIDCMAGNKV